MEYAIFPMKTISISQRFSNTHKAWDLAGTDTGIDDWYAPCRVRLLALFPITGKDGLYNTVLFGSCDANGNQAEVICQDGVPRVLTFACTHMNSDDYNSFNYVEHKIYEAGEVCYREGVAGLNLENPQQGNHVHMDVAEGWKYKKVKNSVDGQWSLPNLTTIANVFHQLSGFNTIKNANKYTFNTVTSRTYSSEPTPPTQPSTTGYNLYVNKLGLNIRTAPNANSTLVTTVPIGKSLNITSFLNGFQSDGYQWAATDYNGYKGYSQIDTKGCYTVLTNPNVNAPKTLYLVASSSGAYVRTSIPSGTATFVPANSKMKVLELLPGFQSDGYQWAKVSYNKPTGYVQVDVKNWHYFTI